MRRRKYTRKQLAEKASLADLDLVEVERCRGDHNRLGFAYQIGFVKLLNRFPAQRPLEVIDELNIFTGIQLGLDHGCIERYKHRRGTVGEHQERIRKHLNLRRFGPEETRALGEFIFEESYRLEQTAALQSRAEEFLKARGILLPADYALARIIGEQKKRATEHIFARVADGLPGDVSNTLDEMLEVQPGEVVSRLQKIKANPAKPSADAVLSLIEKLTRIEATGVLGVDLSWINSNYQRALFHYVRKCTVYRLREVAQSRRDAALVCFLWQSYQDAIDQLVDMFDKLLTRVHTQAKHELDDQMSRQRRMIRESLSTLRSLGEIILDDSVSDAELRGRIFSEISQEELITRVETLAEWVSGKKGDLFHGVLKRFGYLRKFSPALLRALEFVQESEGAEIPCMEALKVLKELNADNKRKLPEGAPTDFVPASLLPLVENGGKPDKRAWECALLGKLRDEIKSGNISVKYSKRFGRFDNFFIAGDQWEALREGFFHRSGLPANPEDVPGCLSKRLDEAYDRFLETAPGNSYATADGDGWHLSADPSERLDQESQQKIDHLKGWLSKHMRRVRLPDLLIEVDNELGFTRHFMTPAQRQGRVPEDVCIILAAVMAQGCNIGPYTMAQLTAEISYKQLKRVSDWQMTEEAQRGALAELVSAISGLDTSLSWGEGRTSASDGQRFSLPRKVLQQTYSIKFSDFALEFYSFVADNYAPFYSTPIECTDRDAAFVLDGLLYNESDLELEEHYTDTHGYTEINFAAFAMLGRRFCPRIRGLRQQRIYRLDRSRDYGPLNSLVSRLDRTLDTRIITEQWDRIGQFYASLESGHTTASVALKRLASYSAKNSFYRANRDLGRIFKTEFILEYMSQPELRSRVRRGILKIEQLHAMARDVYYGRRGRINARELHEQMNSCSCLTLILACIIYWQAKEISAVVSRCDPERNDVDVSCLKHVSPIEWDNVVLYGQYILDRKLIR